MTKDRTDFVIKPLSLGAKTNKNMEALYLLANMKISSKRLLYDAYLIKMNDRSKTKVGNNLL